GRGILRQCSRDHPQSFAALQFRYAEGWHFSTLVDACEALMNACVRDTSVDSQTLVRRLFPPGAWIAGYALDTTASRFRSFVPELVQGLGDSLLLLRRQPAREFGFHILDVLSECALIELGTLRSEHDEDAAAVAGDAFAEDESRCFDAIDEARHPARREEGAL